jgi:hypothetical protein
MESAIMDITRELNEYRRLSQGRSSLNDTSQVTPWGGYAAAVGASLTMAGVADAAIIYSGVQNVSVDIPTMTDTSNMLGIDVDGGGTDLRLGLRYLLDPDTGSGHGTSGVALIFGSGGLVAGAFEQGTGSQKSNPVALDFAGGVSIGATAFASPGGGILFGDIYRITFDPAGPSFLPDGAGLYGRWNLGSSTIAGFRLGTLMNPQFGWVRLRVDDQDMNGFPDRITAVDWAYDDSGAAIQAGAVPEPSSLGLLAAGAAGITAMRRRSRSKRKKSKD